MVYVIQVCRQLVRRSFSSTAVYKSVWHIPLLSVQCINSWWRTDELTETCRVSCQNKFVKLVHLVGFIIKKSVTMHGHMNVKYYESIVIFYVPCIVWKSICITNFTCTKYVHQTFANRQHVSAHHMCHRQGVLSVETILTYSMEQSPSWEANWFCS